MVELSTLLERHGYGQVQGKGRTAILGAAGRTVCGLKLTHDGTVAVVEDGRLVFSYEMEKLNNNRRYEQLDQLGDVAGILARAGCRAQDIDAFVVDGWHADPQTGLARLAVTSHDEPVELEIAPYHEPTIQSDPAARS